MKTFSYPTTIFLALLSTILATPIPETDETDETDKIINIAATNTTTTGSVENASSSDWYIWCGTTQRTVTCTSAPGNFNCLKNGASHGNKDIKDCRDNCRCLPECSYVNSLYTIQCEGGMR